MANSFERLYMYKVSWSEHGEERGVFFMNEEDAQRFLEENPSASLNCYSWDAQLESTQTYI